MALQANSTDVYRGGVLARGARADNKAYQSKQAAFVMNPSSIYAYLDGNDKDLQMVTGSSRFPPGRRAP